MRSAAAAVGQLVDDVVAVAEGERVGVVAEAAVQRLDCRSEVIVKLSIEEVLAGFVVPFATKRIAVCAPIWPRSAQR